MRTPDWIHQLFKTIDAMDADRFVTYLTERARLRFGNGPVVTGREKIRKTIAGFFASIKALRHVILETWIHSDVVILQGEVTYTRKDGSQITLPFMNLYRLKEDLIDQYLVYVDISPLYLPNP
jgi:ketosteroid isomerase-like protein